MHRQEIHTDKITKGSRTYFFDINKSERESYYLNISESKKTSEGFEHHRIMIFEEDLNAFVETFKKSLATFKKLTEQAKKDKKAYSVEKIRETHQQAYQPWTTGDDLNLEQLFCEGKDDNTLSELFGRTKGAIQSRIKKLELREKYGF